MSAECTCPLAPEECQHRYGGATEPGSALEFDPECPEHGQSRPECPKGNPTAVTTSSRGAFPDVCLIPAGELWHRAAAVVREPDDPRGAWRCTNGAWLSDGEVHSHGQRLVPVGPLLELAEEWLSQGAYHGSDLRALLASLLGEPPESHARQEGQ